MPSFDVVSEANMIEVKNAIEQSNKEISTRFDFTSRVRIHVSSKRSASSRSTPTTSSSSAR